MYIGLDEHATAVFAGLLKRHAHMLFVSQVYRHPTAMVRVERFENHRVTDLLRTAHGVVFAVDERLAGDGQADVGQNLVGLVFVGRNFHCYMGSAARHRRLNPLLVFAMAELDQAVIV